MNKMKSQILIKSLSLNDLLELAKMIEQHAVDGWKLIAVGPEMFKMVLNEDDEPVKFTTALHYFRKIS